MERKIQEIYTYEGFGFPVELTNVPMVKTRGQWTPDIDYSKLQREIILALALKPSCLSGSEIRFVRKYFKMTLESFGSEFGVSHVAVIDWEAEADNQAKINPATEKCIRLFILDSLVKRAERFRDGYHKVNIKMLAKQQKSKTIQLSKRSPFRYDMTNLQAI